MYRLNCPIVLLSFSLASPVSNCSPYQLAYHPCVCVCEMPLKFLSNDSCSTAKGRESDYTGMWWWRGVSPNLIQKAMFMCSPCNKTNGSVQNNFTHDLSYPFGTRLAWMHNWTWASPSLLSLHVRMCVSDVNSRVYIIYVIFLGKRANIYEASKESLARSVKNGTCPFSFFWIVTPHHIQLVNNWWTGEEPGKVEMTRKIADIFKGKARQKRHGSIIMIIIMWGMPPSCLTISNYMNHSFIHSSPFSPFFLSF